MTTQHGELAPVDWLLVEFVGSSFDDLVRAIDRLVQRRVVRILDIVLLRKREDGALEAFEVPDRDEARLGRLVPPQTQLALLLSAGDVAAVGAAVEPGSTAVCLVWENLWAAPFTAAVRQAGGQMVAGGRIPVPALLAAVDELTDEQPELDLPLSTRRAGPPSVLGGLSHARRRQWEPPQWSLTR